MLASSSSGDGPFGHWFLLPSELRLTLMGTRDTGITHKMVGACELMIDKHGLFLRKPLSTLSSTISVSLKR